MGSQKHSEITDQPENFADECKRCLMDVTAPDFVASQMGCNYCDEFLEGSKQHRQLSFTLDELVGSIKSSAASKPYDCIVGLSGGLDSSWVLHRAVALGLKPLAVHMDNGWNSELATSNIRQLVSTLKVDLETHVIDWEEYQKMMLCFLGNDVVDVELLYDNAMLGVCFGLARRYGIKHILSGSNHSTEGIRMPPTWASVDKRDKTNILAICNARMKDFPSFPFYSNFQYIIDRLWHRIRWVALLDHETYKKEDSVETLVRLYGYRPYPYKHYENVFTRFYQAEILPRKFGFDKRKPHLSALIMTGQITREEGADLLQQSGYPSPEEAALDRQFFVKKMGWTMDDLDIYLSRPGRSHYEWETDYFSRVVFPMYRWLNSLKKKINSREGRW